jgi:hypothetical protein
MWYTPSSAPAVPSTVSVLKSQVVIMICFVHRISFLVMAGLAYLFTCSAKGSRFMPDTSILSRTKPSCDLFLILFLYCCCNNLCCAPPITICVNVKYWKEYAMLIGPLTTQL